MSIIEWRIMWKTRGLFALPLLRRGCFQLKREVNMNPFITVKLKCPDLEKAYDIEVPTNVNVGKLTGDLKEMVNAYLSEKHPMEGEDYCIISERLDRILWKNETLEEAGIRDGDTIVLEKRGEGPRIVGAVPDAVKEEKKEEKKKIWEQLKGISRKEMAVIAAGVVFVLIVCIKSIIGGLDTTEPQSGGSSASASKETKTGGSDENDTDNTPVVYSLDSGESKTEDAGEAKTENTGESKTEDAGKSKTVEKPEPKPKKTETTETENTEPQPTETETTKPETTETENTEPETTEPETTEPAVVTPLKYNPSTVEDYSANLKPSFYLYYDPGYSDSHAKAFRFSYPSNLFNVAISDYDDFELYGGRNKETHTLIGSKGSVMLVGLYQRTGNDNLSLSDKVDQILDREGEVAESACLRIGRAIGRVWESEEFDEILATQRELRHHGTALCTVFLADYPAPQDTAVESQGSLIIRTYNGDMIDATQS